MEKPFASGADVVRTLPPCSLASSLAGRVGFADDHDAERRSPASRTATSFLDSERVERADALVAIFTR
jgi:hypothetical protein